MSEDRKKSPTEQYFAERAKERAKEAVDAFAAASVAPVTDRCPLCGHAVMAPLADGTLPIETPPIVRHLRPDEVTRPAKLAADAERAKDPDPADPAKA